MRAVVVLDVVDINLSLISELKGALAIFLAKCVRLVDFGVFWEFAIRFYYTTS